MTLRFSVLGDPKTKGSLRPGVGKNGKPFVTESSGAGLRTWREKLASILEPIGRQMGEPGAEPVAAFCHFRISPPKHPRWPWPVTKRQNDIDKFSRAVLDHLAGVVIDDDSQVCLLVATKSYGQPGVDVVVKDLSGLADPDHHSRTYIDLAALMLEALTHVDLPKGEEVNPDVAGDPRDRDSRVALPLEGTP
jgi:Holliday junction resolvase RusA-like endonuclease